MDVPRHQPRRSLDRLRPPRPHLPDPGRGRRRRISHAEQRHRGQLPPELLARRHPHRLRLRPRRTGQPLGDGRRRRQPASHPPRRQLPSAGARVDPRRPPDRGHPQAQGAGRLLPHHRRDLRLPRRGRPADRPRHSRRIGRHRPGPLRLLGWRRPRAEPVVHRRRPHPLLRLRDLHRRGAPHPPPGPRHRHHRRHHREHRPLPGLLRPSRLPAAPGRGRRRGLARRPLAHLRAQAPGRRHLVPRPRVHGPHRALDPRPRDRRRAHPDGPDHARRHRSSPELEHRRTAGLQLGPRRPLARDHPGRPHPPRPRRVRRRRNHPLPRPRPANHLRNGARLAPDRRRRLRGPFRPHARDLARRHPCRVRGRWLAVD